MRKNAERNGPGFLETLEQSHGEILEQTARLDRLLTNLRYEGKPSFGKNLREAGQVSAFFEKRLMPHMRLEEKILFPFLEAHLPKLESFIHLLEWEHEDFRRTFGGFKLDLKKLTKGKREDGRSAFIETGVYLLYLLKHHLEAENLGLYRVIKKELRPGEKKKLAQTLRRRG